MGTVDIREDEPEWFPGIGSTPYLGRVRLLAAERLVGLIAPDHTWSMEYSGALLVVDVPEVPDGEAPTIRNHIQVLWDGRTLGGYWGCSHLWDDFDEQDEEALVVRGVPMTGEQAADVAVGWLAGQLRRPLDLEVWERGGRRARRWVLADTGSVLGSRGGWFTRRGEPTAVTRLRP